MTLTERIKASPLSRADICAQAGISPTMLSLIESGKRQIGPSKVAPLAAALGCSVTDLRPDLAAIFVDQKPSDGEEAA